MEGQCSECWSHPFPLGEPLSIGFKNQGRKTFDSMRWTKIYKYIAFKSYVCRLGLKWWWSHLATAYTPRTKSHSPKALQEIQRIWNCLQSPTLLYPLWLRSHHLWEILEAWTWISLTWCHWVRNRRPNKTISHVEDNLSDHVPLQLQWQSQRRRWRKS